MSRMHEFYQNSQGVSVCVLTSDVTIHVPDYSFGKHVGLTSPLLRLFCFGLGLVWVGFGCFKTEFHYVALAVLRTYHVDQASPELMSNHPASASYA